MSSSTDTTAFKSFNRTFQTGVKQIKAAHQSDELGEVAAAAYNDLRNTAFGEALVGESGLQAILDRLEGDLMAWTTLMLEDRKHKYTYDHPAIAWAGEDSQEEVRRFLYWGRLGEAFHYFRDQGQLLSTDGERESRDKVRQAADSLIKQVNLLLTDLVAQTTYKEDMLKRTSETVRGLERLKADLKLSPVDIAKGAANPLHGGWTLRRRQFLTVVNLMSFELFGNVNPQVLDRLLDMKSSTADRLGLIGWPLSAEGAPLTRDSRISMMREQIRDDMKLARYKARKRNWLSRDVIEYFAAHPEKRRSLHGHDA